MTRTGMVHGARDSAGSAAAFPALLSQSAADTRTITNNVIPIAAANRTKLFMLGNPEVVKTTGSRKSIPLQARRFVGLQTFSQADDIVHRVAKAAIKLDHALIGRAHLQVDLGAALQAQKPLGFRHDLPPQALALMLGGNAEVID